MQSRAKQDARKKDFKKGITAEDSRRKREETSNEIRKSKREESLQKRRNIAPSNEIEITQQSIHTEWTGNLSEIPQYIEAINSNDPVAQLEATTQIRKLLSIEKNPPIAAVVQTGVLPKLITFLGAHAFSKLQFEAAWAITNIASGSSEHTLMVVNCGAVPIFVNLLSAVDEELREQCVWALGNIAGDSSKCRDYCLHAGMLVPLLKILSSGTARLSMMRNATWALSNLCRGKPAPKFSHVAPALSVLAKLIHSSDQEVVVDALWALSYLSDGSDEQIQAVLDSGVAQRIVELLNSSAVSVQTPALRTVGNFVTGNDNQTQTIINLRAIPMFYQLLQNARKSLRKEAAWAISNITAGNKNQTQHVINEGVVPLLVGHLSHGDFDIKKEACWAISNALSWRDSQQVNYVVQCNCIKPLCDMLNQKDTKIVSVALDALEHILYVGDKFSKTPNSNLYSSIVEEAEGIDKIEALQNHENESIYKKAVSILEQYFGAEEESENAVPNVQPMQSSHAFTFGAPMTTPTGGFAF